MAGYGHSYRGYSTHSPPSSDDWGRTSSASDHVCRPVIIDAEGRKRPIIAYDADQNAERYFTETETIVQQRVHSPFDSEYKHGLRWTEDPYGAENKFRKPLTSANGRPQNVEEFITKVQTEASQPNGATWNDSHRRQTPKSTGYDGYAGGYGEHNDFYDKDLPKSGGQKYRNDNYDDYFRKQGNTFEPSTTTSGGGGWGKPYHSARTTSPNASLSGATNDINAAIGLLKEAAKPSVTSSPQPRYRGQGYTETIDSREAAKRYGNFNFFSRPYNREENYTTTIDSREAARKYDGSTV